MLRLLPTTVVLFLLLAPAALAHDQGQGWYGETNDKVVTNAGFVLIAAFPLIIFTLSMLQRHLDKRKDARKKATKARAANRQWQGGW
jgi:preprotein translocase subunit SecG